MPVNAYKATAVRAGHGDGGGDDRMFAWRVTRSDRVEQGPGRHGEVVADDDRTGGHVADTGDDDRVVAAGSDVAPRADVRAAVGRRRARGGGHKHRRDHKPDQVDSGTKGHAGDICFH